MTKVKICGLTRLHDARTAAAAGADFLGFIQHEESPRYVKPDVAKEIIEWVRGPEPVGVFVNRDADEINATCTRVGFTLAQLHGHESPETCAAVDVPVIKAISVQHDASSEQVRAMVEPYLDVVDFVLLDTHHTSLWGGTGESFNWRVARDLSADVDLFLAGGISAANVAEAIQTMQPYAVDLSSSIESEPGVKDLDEMAAFFDAFHAATAG
ncbi:N-(5'-phosphoribosyl)anthranilate isomerase [Rubrivirga sp. SAORIC476]|uniref:phosphoribosylanthranilate isomerase n=1 Tax=Rubrivirga sp. SAORIC476 TaxID=1961794 RepID=UPI000BA99980|nr:phosphoribosylanthranilate isomerase [Rubrivirga sp. SAORIC476]MAQ95476.1 N-(5'-phosphoribosyl)anthranilate isomerase [Rhodothermaceae bacterium]MBC11774.1 N-(5'-phosphoribosyl)anthranilate isomerase [Rhodothermaceae bacterium]PAP80704.1 N-(5'-phosphoribosyl)anthranilate isomerase [Rubrivirga sp. SAORIC476]